MKLQTGTRLGLYAVLELAREPASLESASSLLQVAEQLLAGDSG